MCLCVTIQMKAIEQSVLFLYKARRDSHIKVTELKGIPKKVPETRFVGVARYQTMNFNP